MGAALDELKKTTADIRDQVLAEYPGISEVDAFNIILSRMSPEDVTRIARIGAYEILEEERKRLGLSLWPCAQPRTGARTPDAHTLRLSPPTRPCARDTF